MEKLRVVTCCDDEEIKLFDTYENDIPVIKPNLLGSINGREKKMTMHLKPNIISFTEVDDSTIYVKAKFTRLISAKYVVPENMERAVVRKGNRGDVCLMIVPSELGGLPKEVNLVPVKKVVASYGGFMVSRLVSMIMREWLECFREEGASINFQAMLSFGHQTSFKFCLQLNHNGRSPDIPCTIGTYLQNVHRPNPLPAITEVVEDPPLRTVANIVREGLDCVPVVKHLATIFDSIRDWWRDGDYNAALIKAATGVNGMFTDCLKLGVKHVNNIGWALVVSRFGIMTVEAVMRKLKTLGASNECIQGLSMVLNQCQVAVRIVR